MTNRFLKRIFSLLTGQFLIIGLLSLTSCEDEPARLSGGVLPEGEIIKGLNFNDYLLNSENIARSSIKTGDATYGIIGTFNDTVFGQSKASFATDFSIGSRVTLGAKIYMPTFNGEPFDTVYSTTYYYKFNNNNDTIPNDIWSVDSVMLNLQYQYNDWYGDMTTPQLLNVYELSSSLGGNSDYYSDSEIGYLPNSIGTKTVFPNDDVPDSLKSSNWSNLWEYPDSLLNVPQYLWDVSQIAAAQDSGWLDSDYSDYSTKTKYWQIKLNDEVANRIFNLDSTTLSNSNEFKSVFPGIYVTKEDITQSGEGNLTRINLVTTGSAINTNITIHVSRAYKYINSEDEVRDTSSTYSYSFPINVENTRLNTYEHSKDDRIKLDDPTTQSLYVQGMAGVYSKFSMPEEIRFWADSLTQHEEYKLEGEPYKRASNIEFYLEVDTLSYPTNQGGIQRYPLPKSLTIRSIDKDGDLSEPTYTSESGNTYAIFGNGTYAGTSTSGNGELVTRRQENEDGTYRYEYLYRFLMKAEYFNYIMEQLDDTRYANDWDIDSDEFLQEFRRVFKNEFYIGPSDPTSNFRRVKLFGASHPSKPFKMNIKYFNYTPR